MTCGGGVIRRWKYKERMLQAAVAYSAGMPLEARTILIHEARFAILVSRDLDYANKYFRVAKLARAMCLEKFKPEWQKA